MSKVGQQPSNKSNMDTRAAGVIKRQGTRKDAEEQSPIERGIPQNIYVQWVKSQLDGESACLELPFTILLVVSFSLLAIAHLNQDVVLVVERSLESMLSQNAVFAYTFNHGQKNIYDVHTVPDFWSWLRIGFIPLAFAPSWQYSESYFRDKFNLFGLTDAPNQTWQFGGLGSKSKSAPVKGNFLHYNRIVGGFRFQQQLMDEGEPFCKFPSGLPMEQWLQWYGKSCHGSSQELAINPDMVTVEDALERPERVEWMFTDMDSQEDLLQQAVDMEDGCAQMAAKNRTCLCKTCNSQDSPTPWVTDRTQRIKISMATFNPEYGLISMSSVHLFFSRGGAVQQRVQIESSWMDPLSTPLGVFIPMLTCDIIWLGMIIYITVAELKEITAVIQVGEGRWYMSLWNNYLAFWNGVDWVSIISAAAVVGGFMAQLQSNVAMHKSFMEVIAADKDPSNREAFTELVREFYECLENVTDHERSFRLSLCIYPMIVMLRLFKSFAAQARLAVVTDTLSEAAQDLLHFFIVFFSVFFCLCMTSVLLFGLELKAFRTFPRALHTCFMMMFGDWEWEPMEEIRRMTAVIWFALFMLLMVIILLNMLLAIIMDNYMKVKKTSSQAITLKKQIEEIWRRHRQFKRKERVRLNEVLDAFEKEAGTLRKVLESDRPITPIFLMDFVDGIPASQATRTLTNAWQQHLRDTTPPFDLEHSRQPLLNLDVATREIRDALFYTYDRVDYYDTNSQKKDEGGGGGDAQAPPKEGGETATPPATPAAWAASPAPATSSGAVVLQNVEEEPLHSSQVPSLKVVEQTVDEKVARLGLQAAGPLAQMARRVNKRQNHIERRQSDITAAVREMHSTLLNLQTEAASLVARMHSIRSDRSSAKASGWRRGLQGMASCLEMPPEDPEPPMAPMVMDRPS